MNTFQRTAISGLVLSAGAFVAMLASEGYSPVAYTPVPGDKITIGFGETRGVKPGDTITPVKAVERALSSVAVFEGAIKQCVKVPLYQYEYDAYLQLSYNIGSGAFCGSTLVKRLNTFDYEGACRAILQWDQFKGKPLRGLTLRRQREYQLCTGNQP